MLRRPLAAGTYFQDGDIKSKTTAFATAPFSATYGT